MSGPERWFLPEENAKNGVSRLFKESAAQAFIDAPEFYAELRKEIEFTTANADNNSWLFWIGFELSGNTWMPAAPPRPSEKKPYSPICSAKDDVELLDLLRAADHRGVRLRALLNLHPYPADKDSTQQKRYERHNLKLVTTINETFHNAFAINDFRYLLMNGTHHQKLFLIHNKRGFFAFCGGIDLELARIQWCWSDFHCRFQGDVVGYFYKLFRDRWLEHFKVHTKDIGFDTYTAYLPNLVPHGGKVGNILCQVTTTYGNASRSNPFGPIPGKQWAEQNINRPHSIVASFLAVPGPFFYFFGEPFRVRIPFLIYGNDFFKGKDPAAPKLLEHAAKQEPTYSFAPVGHHGIYDAIEHAIAKTRRYIYIEDQYIVCDQPMDKLRSMLDILKDKLTEEGFQRLVIFSTRIDEINSDFLQTGWKHRGNMMRTLLSAARRPDQVIFCQYKSNRQLRRPRKPVVSGKEMEITPGSSPFYVHSKTWIFDDELLISGSANFNRRGYSHDSEVDFAICSPSTDFVKQTRIRLWRRRLFTEGFKGSTPPSDADLADFDSACRYWLKPSQFTADIESTAEVSMAPFEPVDFQDATAAELNVNVSRLLQIPGKTAIMWKVSLYDLLWDYVVDPEGT